MFVVSKLMALLTQPLAWVVVLLMFGLLLMRRRPRAAHRFLSAALALLLLIGWLPLPDALLRVLEQRHPAPTQIDVARYAGVIVLGGATESAYVWEGHAQPALNSAAERMTAALPLLREHPPWKLLFTGGEGELIAGSLTEAERARRFFAQMGVPPSQLLLEDQSRTTHENAVLSAQLPGVDKTQPWLLVTSAWHMPRAFATFEKTGWNVTPWPVDYRAGLRTPWTQYSLAQGVSRWQTALHEYLGLLAYRLLGRQ
jgi:uncharacterized SAM-binding protein YcdF (DUF218 family)